MFFKVALDFVLEFKQIWLLAITGIENERCEMSSAKNLAQLGIVISNRKMKARIKKKIVTRKSNDNLVAYTVPVS